MAIGVLNSSRYEVEGKIADHLTRLWRSLLFGLKSPPENGMMA